MLSKTTRLEGLLEAVPDALVGMDQEGMIRFVNRQTEALFGYDRGQLIGRHIDSLVPETLYAVYTQHQEDYFADPRTRSCGLEVQLDGRHQNGGEFPINISMSEIDTGDVLLVITARGDVIRQRRAVEGAQLTAAIVEFSDDALIGSTLEGVVTSWNPAAERMYGYSSEEIIGVYAGRLSPQDRAGEFADSLARLKAEEAVERLETVRIRKDGTVFFASITLAPIRSEEGAIVGASVICRDVTEQRRAFDSAQRMAAVVESLDDAIIGETIEGVITSWNRAATRMFGYSSEEIIGQYAGRLSPQDRAGELSDSLARLKADQAVERLETVQIRKDGTVFPASITMAPMRSDEGAIVGASVICREVTEPNRAFEAAQPMATIVESSNDAVIGGTLEGVTTSGNPAAKNMYGHSAEQAIGKSGKRLGHGNQIGENDDLGGEPQSEVTSTMTGGSSDTFAVQATLEATRGLLWITSAAEAAALAVDFIAALGGTTASAAAGAGSETIPVDVSFGEGPPLLPAAPQLSVARMLLERYLPEFVRDAQRAVEVVEQTSRLAKDDSIDELTGLANKRSMGRVLGRLRTQDTVIMIDLDDLKAVNRNLGHLEGDRVLRALGLTLASILGATEQAGRYGGDEVVVIIADAGAETFLTRLQLAWVAARPHLVTFSAGIASAAPTAADSARTLEAADRAMGRAKDAGGDQWHWATVKDYR